MRLVIHGSSGSGKTTLGRQIAAARDVPFFDMDDFNWRPGWTSRSVTDLEGLRADVRAALSADRWVATGAYRGLRDLSWGRATDFVWLDLPLAVIMRRLILRSLQRSFSGQDVFPGCREHWWRLFDPEHPIPYTLANHGPRRTSIPQQLQLFPQARLHHCTSPQAVEALRHSFSAAP